jgi:hypothetical protein
VDVVLVAESRDLRCPILKALPCIILLSAMDKNLGVIGAGAGALGDDVLSDRDDLTEAATGEGVATVASERRGRPGRRFGADPVSTTAFAIGLASR